MSFTSIACILKDVNVLFHEGFIVTFHNTKYMQYIMFSETNEIEMNRGLLYIFPYI